MGSGQSARKLTINNEEEVGVIKVSNAIIQRLQGLESEPAAQDVVRTPPAPEGVAAPLPPGAPPPNGYPVHYYPGYTVSALEIQQQREKELASQDQYWKRRLQNMERNHERVDQIIEMEYRKAMQELAVGGGAKKKSASGGATPCVENSEKVLKCYQDHPKETLKCSSLVEEFTNCVDQRRANIIAARC